MNIKSRLPNSKTIKSIAKVGDREITLEKIIGRQKDVENEGATISGGEWLAFGIKRELRDSINRRLKQMNKKSNMGVASLQKSDKTSAMSGTLPNG